VKLEPHALQGEDGTAEVSASLAQVASILHESFDPIIDLVTGQDLLPVMVYAQELGAWDYTGMYSAVLQHQVTCWTELFGRHSERSLMAVLTLLTLEATQNRSLCWQISAVPPVAATSAPALPCSLQCILTICVCKAAHGSLRSKAGTRAFCLRLAGQSGADGRVPGVWAGAGGAPADRDAGG